MIFYCTGNIFDSTAQTLVNPVNCEGVMGKGLAVEFKRRWPAMFREYNQMCRKHDFFPGRIWLYRNRALPNILLFATKYFWNKPSQLDWIEMGLDSFVRCATTLEIASVAFPRLGCGNGGLRWEDVQPVMEDYLGELNIHVEIWSL